MKTKPTYSLLIYWGEGVDLYLIPNDVADKKRKLLAKCQNRLINVHKITKPMEKLSALLASKKEHVPQEELAKYAAKWRKYKVGVESPLTGKKITTVYFSGFAP